MYVCMYLCIYLCVFVCVCVGEFAKEKFLFEVPVYLLLQCQLNV
jgi:hypothetical protein